MHLRHVTVSFFILALSFSSGCSSLSNSLPAFLRSDPGLTAGDGNTDPWVNEHGSLTNKLHPHEEVVDPLDIRKFFMSEKAREIERNCGVGD